MISLSSRELCLYYLSKTEKKKSSLSTRTRRVCVVMQLCIYNMRNFTTVMCFFSRCFYCLASFNRHSLLSTIRVVCHLLLFPTLTLWWCSFKVVNHAPSVGHALRYSNDVISVVLKIKWLSRRCASVCVFFFVVTSARSPADWRARYLLCEIHATIDSWASRVCEGW